MSQRLQQPVAWLTRVDEGGFVNLRDFAVFPWFGHNVLFPDLPPWPTYSLPTFFLFFCALCVLLLSDYPSATFIGLSIFAYRRLKNGWLMEYHLLKSAVQLRTRLMGSADWPTPGEAKLMVDLVKQLELRNDPGIELPTLRTDLSPPSHFVRLTCPTR